MIGMVLHLMKMRKNAKQLFRKGRKILGAVYELSDGRNVFLAWRKQSDIFKAGEKTNSEALVKHLAAWSIDYDILLNLRRTGINIVGVYVKDTNDFYITHISNFFNTRSKLIQPKKSNGVLQRQLPIDFFALRLGETKLR